MDVASRDYVLVFDNYFGCRIFRYMEDAAAKTCFISEKSVKEIGISLKLQEILRENRECFFSSIHGIQWGMYLLSSKGEF